MTYWQKGEKKKQKIIQQWSKKISFGCTDNHVIAIYNIDPIDNIINYARTDTITNYILTDIMTDRK